MSKTIIVTSNVKKDGEYQPVHFIDPATVVNGEPLRITIDSKMARKRIGVKVLDCTFVRGKMAEGLLIELPSKLKKQAKVKPETTKAEDTK